MICVVCGNETKNKTKNKPVCREHIYQARKDRDAHNLIVQGNLKNKEEYFSTDVLAHYKGKFPLENLCRTTTQYQLVKNAVKAVETKIEETKKNIS